MGMLQVRAQSTYDLLNARWCKAMLRVATRVVESNNHCSTSAWSCAAQQDKSVMLRR